MLPDAACMHVRCVAMSGPAAGKKVMRVHQVCGEGRRVHAEGKSRARAAAGNRRRQERCACEGAGGESENDPCCGTFSILACHPPPLRVAPSFRAPCLFAAIGINAASPCTLHFRLWTPPCPSALPPAPLHLVLVDLKAAKDTTTILRSLQGAYPRPATVGGGGGMGFPAGHTCGLATTGACADEPARGLPAARNGGWGQGPPPGSS